MGSISLARLSVYVDLDDAHPIYEKLTSRSPKKAEEFPFETMKDLFILAACVGAKYDKFIPIKQNKDIFDSTLFDQRIEVPLLFSLAYYKTKDIDVLLDSRQVLDIAQSWANGGIHIIEDAIFNQPGGHLFNLSNFIFNEITPSSENNSVLEVTRMGFSVERDKELTNDKSSKNFNVADCADLLAILETELRSFIASGLSPVSDNWWKQRIPEDIRERAEKRKASREQTYPGMGQQECPIYEYLDFPDLQTIITSKNNWDEVFKETFKRPDFVQVKLGEINPIRNDIAHHRDIPIEGREIFVSNARQFIRTIRTAKSM